MASCESSPASDSSVETSPLTDAGSETASPLWELPAGPGRFISRVYFSPYTTSRLLVSCWDKNLYLYDVLAENDEGGRGKLLSTYPHDHPVVACCFGRSDDEAFTSTVYEARMSVPTCPTNLKRRADRASINLATGENLTISWHRNCTRFALWCPQVPMAMSASTSKPDGPLYLHHFHPGTSILLKVLGINIPGGVFSLAFSQTKLVVASRARSVFIYELDKLGQLLLEKGQHSVEPEPIDVTPWQVREGAAKFMFRNIACMPTDAGYAQATIEGRVSVEWFDPSEESQARKYAFKCHRHTVKEKDSETGEITETEQIYPVHNLAFHPVHVNTFASCGGDGVVALWDAAAKRRIRQYQRLPASVASVAWSKDGKYLAMAMAPDPQGENPDPPTSPIKVLIREMADGEAAGKSRAQ